MDLLNRYSDVLKDYFPTNYFGEDNTGQNENGKKTDDNRQTSTPSHKENNINSDSTNIFNQNENSNNTNNNVIASTSAPNSDDNSIPMNSSDVGGDSPKASEIIKHDSAKQIGPINIGIILFVIIGIIAFAVGYKKQNKN